MNSKPLQIIRRLLALVVLFHLIFHGRLLVSAFISETFVNAAILICFFVGGFIAAKGLWQGSKLGWGAFFGWSLVATFYFAICLLPFAGKLLPAEMATNGLITINLLVMGFAALIFYLESRKGLAR